MSTKDTRSIGIITNKDELFTTITNWERNRPPDMCRVKEIVEDMTTRDAEWVDGIILIWENPKQELKCFDGIHRIEAARVIEKPIQLLVQFYSSKREADIMEEFIRINKGVPVSRLYSAADAELQLRNTITDVVKHFQSKYSPFFSPCAKPRVPHENRDRMMERLLEMIEKRPKMKHFTSAEWITHLTNMSISIQHRHNSGNRKYKLSRTQKEKCETHDFYLFAKKDWFNE
jgi:hypothetical protein